MHRAALLGCLSLVFAASVVGPAVAVDGPSATRGVAVQENNSTTQHEQPAAATGDGDEADVRRWLEGRLGSMLAESSVKLSQGEYEAADDVIGEEYESYLSKYVEVAGETDGLDTESERALNETGARQREFVSLAARYQETYEQYQAARADGNETRARELARRLDRLADELSETGDSLSSSLNETGALLDVDLSDSRERVDAVTATVLSRQRSVVESTFVRTAVSVTLVNETGSFTDPFRVRGRIESLGNESLPASVAVSVNGRVATVPVDGNGTFERSYRPTTIPTGNQSLVLEYVPATDSVFLGNETTVRARVLPVTPEVAVEASPGAVRYDTPITVTGRVSVDDTGVGGVPVTLSLGDVTLGSVQSSSNGSFTATLSVPADVAAGTRAVSATVEQDGRAVARASGTTTVTVDTASTDLSLETGARADTVTVTGRLTTDSGTPVGGERVTITRNGSTLTAATTNESGYYVATVPRLSESSELRASYDGSGSHLESASASTTLPGVDTGSGLPGVDTGSGGPSLVVVLAAVLVVLAAGVGGAYAYRRRSSGGAGGGSNGGQPGEAPAGDRGEAVDHEALVESVADRDPSRANVAALYGVARRVVAARTSGAAEEATAREFLDEVASELGEQAASLRELTAAYERATYGGEAPTEADWERVVGAARRLVDHSAFADEAESEGR